MDGKSIREAAIRYGLLFLISVALVAGFWFHSEFYQLGLYPLLLIGGFATFLVLLALRTIGSGRAGWSKTRGSLPVPRDAAERVLAGTQTLAVLPATATVPPANALANAVVAGTDVPLTRVRIQDVRRVLASDVQEAEALAAGFEGLAGFHVAWSAGHRWNPREIVLLVEFRREVRA